MHDINFIRNNSVSFDNSMKSRGIEPCAKKIIRIDEEKRNTQTILQNILSEKNNLSKEIGNLKANNKNADLIIKKVEKINDQISSLKELEKIKDDELQAILIRLPNVPHKTVPLGFLPALRSLLNQ